MPAPHDPKKLVYTQHNLANVYREMGDLDRALACLAESDEIARVHLLPIQRSFHLTSIAHIQLQQGRIDERAGHLSRSGRSQPAGAARRRPGAVAADARQRAPRPRAVRGGAAVSAGGGAALRATGRPRLRSGDADRRRPILERTSLGRGRAGVERRARSAAHARRLARRAARRAKGSHGRSRERGRATPSRRSNRRWRSRPRSASARARLRFATRSASSSGSAAATPRR